MLLPKIFCFYFLFKLSTARYVQVAPKFSSEDSAVVLDADRPLPPRMHPKLQNALYYNYPVYHLIKQQQQSRLSTASSTTSTTTTTTTTTTTEAPMMTPINDNDDEFPSDLLYIAQHQLGLKRLDEVPSISELGELLGTANATETINYMRQLTATEQGIALMKAYIETPDYAENGNKNAASKNDVDREYDDNDEDDVIEGTNDDEEVVETPLDLDDIGNGQTEEEQTEEDQAASKTSNGFLQSLSSYMNSLWKETPTTTTTTTTTRAPPRFEVAPGRNMQSYTPLFLPSPGQPSAVLMKPLLVRNPLPYHYPIPIRPFLVPASTVNSIKQTTTTTTSSPVHLNTPRKNVPQTASSNTAATNVVLAPHVKQLAQMADVPPKQLQLLLQRKPKLAELAVRVSNLPLTRPNGGGIDTQLFAAVQRAFEQDDDLKKLLSSVDTLK